MEEWVKFAKENPEVLKYVAASSGSGEKDFLKLKEIVAAVPKVRNTYVSVGLVFNKRQDS